MLLNRTRTLFMLSFLTLVLIALMGCSTAPPPVRIQQLTVQQVYERLPDLESGLILLDVRTPEEWVNDGHIEGATLIPLDELENRASDELPQDAEIIVYCRSGNRSATATEFLIEAGYANVSEMAGGIRAWSESGLPLVTGP